MIRRINKHSGLVLIVVVYLISLLSMFLFALSLRSRVAIEENNLFMEKLQQDQLASAACLQAKILLEDDDPNIDHLDEPWNGWHTLLVKEFTDMNEFPWEIKWRLTDEAAKININLSPADLLLNLKSVDKATVASILDWIDEDDVPNPDGAEQQYYSGLNPPYNCKNSAMESIEEMLLVKGVSPKVLYGADSEDTGDGISKDEYPLNKLLTVYGDGKININTASENVLSIIPLLSDSAVAEIILCQKDSQKKFSSSEDIKGDEEFTDADKITLLQIAKFNTSYFQLDIRIREKEQPYWCEYLIIIERNNKEMKIISWQRINRYVPKNPTLSMSNSIY